MKQLTILGNGEAFSTTQGNTSFLFNYDTNAKMLVDCGFQIPERIWSQPNYSDIDIILLTHHHADHAFGVIPLLVRYLEEKRTRPLHIWGPEGTQAFIESLMEMGYPRVAQYFQFPILFNELDDQQEFIHQNLAIRCAYTDHSIPNLQYRIDFAEGSFSISGDGELTQSNRDLIKGVTYHFQETYELKSNFPGHNCFDKVIELYHQLTIEKLGITHICRNQINIIEKRYQDMISDNLIDPKRLFITQVGQPFNFK